MNMKRALGRTEGKKLSKRKPFKKVIGEHVRCCRISIKRMIANPGSNVLILIVLGFALALPSALYAFLGNVKLLTAGVNQDTRIALFLQMETSSVQVQDLLKRLEKRADIKRVRYISPAQGLKEFKEQSGLGDLLEQIKDNPLPGVIEVIPANNLNSPTRLNTLLSQLKQFPDVQFAQLDMMWVKRLYAIMNLVKSAVLVLGVFLALAVLFIIGNTIRLAVQNRRDEIEIITLLGATHAYVRRPFLYIGMFYGLLGGFFAWVLVGLMMLLLDNGVEKVAALYQGHFSLQGLQGSDFLMLLLISACLGWVGAFFAVNRHLREMAY